MRPDEWARVKNVLAAALALEPGARLAYVSDACAGDSALRVQVEQLLEAHGRADDFLEGSAGAMVGAARVADDLVGRSIGSYRVLSRIGGGAMGNVYLAHDDRLDRRVALKQLAIHLAGEPHHLRRFHAEARAASALNHPNILVIHEAGEVDGRPFIVSEFVEGATLRARLADGPLAVVEALRIAAQIADALSAVHERGIFHRDIKPENIMLRPDGYVKILDFGLAKLKRPPLADADAVLKTSPGVLIGTPRYMSPEQARGLEVDGRSDIWSLGVVLYEMLAGRPPFIGATPSDVIAAILHFDPAPLDRTRIRHSVSSLLARMLAKAVGDRVPDARTMHAELVAVRAAFDVGTPAPEPVPAPLSRSVSGVLVGPVRLIVLPFRMRPAEPRLDFLRFSVADAIVSALTEVAAITVRSSVLAARFVNGEIDLTRIAAEADVNMVLIGTLAPSGDRLRVHCELIEVPSGRVVWAAGSEAPVDDVFHLQDRVVTRIIESLASPLTVPEQRAIHDIPASSHAYECYLRANELARHPSGFDEALDLYLKCVEADARFAPAWARLGRLYRVIGKYSGQDVARWYQHADEAFGRAMSLNPHLSAAQNSYAYLQVDMGRAVAAVQRLLTRARQRPADPDLYAGLVHACRYAGLVDASAAAHQRAMALDPQMPTTVVQTYMMRRELDRALDESRKLAGGSLRAMVLALLGREAEAIAHLQEQESRLPHFTIRQYSVALRTMLEGDRAGCAAAIDHLLAIDFPDPEGLYWIGRYLARIGDPRAHGVIESAIDGGFNALSFMRWDPWIDPIRGTAAFESTLAKAEGKYHSAASVYIEAGGSQVLGPLAAD